MNRYTGSFVIALCLAFGSAQADTTGMTGGGQPFNNWQPSLAVTEVLPMTGLFPSNGGGGAAAGDTLGFVYNFAGNFAPHGSLMAQGQQLPISQNTAVFSLLGTTYGGNGQTTFALPNLVGTSIVGAGTGPGLSPLVQGESTGAATVTLTTGQLPTHNHTLPGGGVTGTTGGNQPFDNMQPSLAMTRLIAINGLYPTGGSAAFIGQIATFAGTFAPGGWAVADGSLLSIAQNTALFSILGTTYGGNGITTFALPDLRGRLSVGADGNTLPLGTQFGQEFTTLTTGQLSAHDHTLAGGGVTGLTGGSQPVSNYQPSLALNYLIALQGIFPSPGGGGFDPDTPILGQIVEFAGDFAPAGWAFARGQLLPIAQNTALFALLGTQYGGNGITTFALPDLRGRTLIGEDGANFPTGLTLGDDLIALTDANLPAHDHTVPTNPTPEPATVVLLGLGLLGLAGVRRRMR